mgnify:FL=1
MKRTLAWLGPMTAVLLSSGIASLPGENQHPPPGVGGADQDLSRVDALVKQLGASEYNVRSAAEESLRKFTDSILPVLEKHRDSDDPEVRPRIRRIIEHIARQRWVVDVGGRRLLLSDVQEIERRGAALRSAMAPLLQKALAPEPDKGLLQQALAREPAKGLRQGIVDAFVERAVLLNEADRKGIALNDEEKRAALEWIKDPLPADTPAGLRALLAPLVQTALSSDIIPDDEKRQRLLDDERIRKLLAQHRNKPFSSGGPARFGSEEIQARKDLAGKLKMTETINYNLGILDLPAGNDVRERAPPE